MLKFLISLKYFEDSFNKLQKEKKRKKHDIFKRKCQLKQQRKWLTF